jgi:integrase
MSSPHPVVVAFPEPAASGWIDWLKEHTSTDWRPGEWDHAIWLCSGDPNNPRTTVELCQTRACGQLLADRGICTQCARALKRSGLTRAAFIETYVPERQRARYGDASRPPCAVERDGSRCTGRAQTRGLCREHYSRWRRCQRQEPSADIEQWLRVVAVPAVHRWPERTCLVLGCSLRPHGAIPLCPLHYARHKKHAPRLPIAVWARTEPPHLAAHQFSLGHLPERLRWEVLYALQQRDQRGGRLAAGTIRDVVRLLQQAPSLATIELVQLTALVDRCQGSAVQAHLFEFARTLRDARDQMLGLEHTDRLVWDKVSLGLSPATNPLSGIRRTPGTIDFGSIPVSWLRELARAWARTESPDGRIITETVQAAALAARSLRRRSDLGEDQASLERRDMDAVVEVFRELSHPDGRLQSVSRRRTMLRRFTELIDYGRRNAHLPGLAVGFNRHSFHLIPFTQARDEDAGRALPDHVIRQLDDNLGRLGRGQAHGELTDDQIAAMFQTAYVILRDTGRRPLEVCSLHVECLSGTEESVLHWNNHKAGRFGRKLPITAATADAIRTWQQIRPQLPAPTRSRDYLFPAKSEVAQTPFLRPHNLGEAIRQWVDQLERLDSDTVNEHGSTVPFDRLRIYPYAFRHTYAQRHADAGVPVDVLRELMDHRHINTTMGYYQITAKRKREAVTALASFVVDRAGRAAPMATPATYEARSVAVPFGNCIEASNVKAGGKSCPVRFQCAGCGFYRPDPSYIPAIEEHLNALRADRQTARAMDVADFVVDNLTAQIDAFTNVLQVMTDKLDTLSVDERDRISEASAVLRKARAGDRTLLPLQVTHSGQP